MEFFMFYKIKSFFSVGVAFLFGIVSLQNFAYSKGVTPSPQVPLTVDQNSSGVIVMEYEAWFTLLHSLSSFQHFYAPLLRSAGMTASGQEGYDSQDPLVIKQHIAWLEALGVNAVIAEQTNGAPCDMSYSTTPTCVDFLNRNKSNPAGQPGYSASINSINQSTFNLYRAFANNGTAIKIIPLVDGWEPEVYIGFGSKNQTVFDNQIRAYLQRMNEYPQLNVIYEGKPLMVVYLSAGQQPGVKTSVLSLAKKAILKYRNRLTIRLMAGFIDSQPSLWTPNVTGISGLHPVNPAYQTWTWVDRLNSARGVLPSYTTAGSRVEAFTVSVATPGTTMVNGDGGWNAPDAGLYNNGQTFNQFLQYAEQLNPIFLIVDQFNEYGTPDQGVDEQRSNDIEPTMQWGNAKYETVQAALLSYESTVQQYLDVGFIKTPQDEAIYFSDGRGNLCSYASWNSYIEAGGQPDFSNGTVVPGIPAAMRDYGNCLTGFFKLPSGAAIYNANGQGHYCAYSDWKAFTTAGGSASNFATISSIPPQMTNDGACV
jgi:hypothetical protein